MARIIYQKGFSKVHVTTLSV